MTSFFEPETTRRKHHSLIITDTSKSMAGEPIQQVNFACRELQSFYNDELPKLHPEIQYIVHVLEFNSAPSWITPAEGIEAERYAWRDLTASGSTNFGKALTELEKRFGLEYMGRRAYPPAVILLTDGYPTDKWDSGGGDGKGPFGNFLNTPYGKASMRCAVGCGQADAQVLDRFVGNSGGIVVWATDPSEIREKLRCLIMSTVVVSSQPLNQTTGEAKSIKATYESYMETEELNDGIAELCE